MSALAYRRCDLCGEPFTWEAWAGSPGSLCLECDENQQEGTTMNEPNESPEVTELRARVSTRLLALVDVAMALGESRLPPEVVATMDRVNDALENDAEAFTPNGLRDIERQINDALARVS